MSEPFRVLQVATIMNRGGLETMLMNYYRHIDRSKVQFDFLVHRFERGAFDDEIEALGGRIFRMPPIHPRYFYQYYKDLNAFFATHPEYTVVHSHLDLLSTFVLHAAKKHGVPVRIAHSHSSYLSDMGLRKAFKLWSRSHLNAQCTHFFACSTEAGVFQFGKKLVEDGKLTVLQNGIDTSKYKFRQETRDRVRQEMGLRDSLVIGHVGRFDPPKNHSFIIDIFKEIAALRPDAKLLLIGDGKLRPHIEEKAASLGLTNKVIFTGIRSDVNELMMAMDLFLFPSLYEGLGIVAVEAQSTGLPVLASTAVPRAAALTPNVYFMPLEQSPREWAQKAISMVRTSSEYNRTKEASAVAAQGYDIKLCAQQLQEFYISCIDKI